ncbi:MAG: SurA N-terminal domain-containing protein [Solirubrobacterales bacterium]
MRRHALILFAALFAFLFVGVALAVGVGSTAASVPPGDVAIVEDAPPGTGTISKAELDQKMLQEAGFGGRKPPKPGEEGYEQAKSEALDGLITAIWLRGQGEAMGIVVGDREVAAELKKSGEAKTLREAHFTRKTMYERVRGEMLVRKIEEALEKEAEKASAAEVRAYLEEEPLTEGESPRKKTFAEAKASLQGIKNQEVFTRFDLAFPETWYPRTHCAEGFVVENCAEYPAFAHAAPAACYEADPKEPAEACPAPVPQSPTAQPGTVTPFKPKGESRVQRPYPEVIEGEAGS